MRLLLNLILSCTLFVANFSSADSFQAITLGVPEFKPYTYTQNGEIKGSAIEQGVQIFNALKLKARLRAYSNYSDLLKALKKNEIQGMFLASQNSERDRYAVFSKPITFNNWSWFSVKHRSPSPDELKNNALIGTIEKTNTFRWLTRNGYQVHGSPVLHLPYLLLNNKVDAVFAAESVFMQACRDQSISLKTFHKTIEVKRPFAMYISKLYLDNNPNFMQALNQEIDKL